MSIITNGHSPQSCVSGQFLAKNKLDPSARAELAAQILDGRQVNFTVAQVARLCRVSAARINTARKSKAEKIAKAWSSATSDERAQFIQHVGTDNVWSAMLDAM